MVETELKLLINQKEIDCFLNHAFLKAYAPQLKHCLLKSVYYDTAALSLLKGGFCLRVREEQGEYLQTIKSGSEAKEGLYQREEWNYEVDSVLPNLLKIEDCELQQKLMQLIGKQKLLAIFETKFQRLSWEVHYENNLIELALDQGTISSKDKIEPISEIELELKAGTVDTLYKVANLLQKTIDLPFANNSKAMRGYKLYTTLSKD